MILPRRTTDWPDFESIYVAAFIEALEEVIQDQIDSIEGYSTAYSDLIDDLETDRMGAVSVYDSGQFNALDKVPQLAWKAMDAARRRKKK